MSDSFRPASAIAFSAASACSWICDTFGMTPSSVVSAAPTTATLFLRIALPFRWAEQGQGDLLVERLEGDLEGHIEFERLGGLRAIRDVAHHARPLLERHHGNRVRRREARGGGTVIDDVAVQGASAGRLENAHLAVGAGRAERTRREIDMRARIAALQPQLADPGAVPEMLRLGCRLGTRARCIGHPDCSSLR